jgi:hypothetical protein
MSHDPKLAVTSGLGLPLKKKKKQETSLKSPAAVQGVRKWARHKMH